MTIKTKIFRFFYFVLRMIVRVPELFGVKTRMHENTIARWLVPMYIKKNFVPLIKDLPEQKPVRTNHETIWQFWTPNKVFGTPDVIKACMNTVEKHRGEKKHIILNNDNLSDFTDLPGFVYDRFKSGDMWPAHFTDIVRLEALHKNGGIWMDATNYMTAPIPEYIDSLPFFIFHAISEGSPYSLIQNCFIKADKGAFLLDGWLALILEYWKKENKKIDYFQHQLMFKALIQGDSRAAKLYSEMPVVDQKETHQLSLEKMLAPFDEKRWAEISSDSFFQKLRYQFKEIPSGSYLDVLTKAAL